MIFILLLFLPPVIWFPRSSVGASPDAPASPVIQPRLGPLERLDGIPTPERGNEKKMAALGAAMRKLVQLAFGVLKHQQPYQANWVPTP